MAKRITRPFALALALLGGACERTPKRELDLDLIHVPGPARMRTDTVGEGKFAGSATFVLVDAENAASEGAYVTLGGELIDATGADVGTLNAQSLWIPSHESRTFALVDAERKQRPETTSARVKVRGALVSSAPPTARIEELHSFDDHGQVVVQAYLVNDANREGQVMVVGAFYDASNRPVARPFVVVKIGASGPGEPGRCPDTMEDKVPLVSRCSVRFVGPAGAKRGTIFVGDAVY
ncbi:MAG: hypothetical protein H6Q90_5182 [Deltaproteobacteria bacterium]|nr:hypothetical protein [Deltaproteobacteria bacterium]